MLRCSPPLLLKYHATHEQFRNYVNKLRAKTNDYKKKRAALLDMRAEGGVLARTQELLSQQRDELKTQLVHITRCTYTVISVCGAGIERYAIHYHR